MEEFNIFNNTNVIRGTEFTINHFLYAQWSVPIRDISIGSSGLFEGFGSGSKTFLDPLI